LLPPYSGWKVDTVSFPEMLHILQTTSYLIPDDHNIETFYLSLIFIAGGDLNQTNVHGTTPLMDLVTYADGDLAVDILHSIWKKKPDVSFYYVPWFLFLKLHDAGTCANACISML
jgi:hypothetical protein